MDVSDAGILQRKQMETQFPAMAYFQLAGFAWFQNSVKKSNFIDWWIRDEVFLLLVCLKGKKWDFAKTKPFLGVTHYQGTETCSQVQFHGLKYLCVVGTAQSFPTFLFT